MKPMCCLKTGGWCRWAGEGGKWCYNVAQGCATTLTGGGGCIAQLPLQETLLEWVNWKNIVGSLSGSFNYSCRTRTLLIVSVIKTGCKIIFRFK